MIDYQIIIIINFTGVILSIYATGIVFVFRSNPYTTNRRRNAAGGSYKAFLELIAKAGIINISVLLLDLFTGIEGEGFPNSASTYLTIGYISAIGIGLLFFVAIGDMISKSLVWLHSKSR